MSGTLYLIGTPIGNLGDISPRALETLSACDLIAAEDTRVSMKLLNHFAIKKPIISYFEHNKEEKGLQILARLREGQSVGLITDAGMPAISDPGEDLVALCHAQGIPVVAVPGPSAFVAAVALSGLPTGRFTFEGFLSMNKHKRREHLEAVREETRTLVFYEAPHKLKNTLRDFLHTFGDREIAIARELTKIHEEVVRTTLRAACAHYETAEPKGEYVLVLAGAPKAPEITYTLSDAVSMAAIQMEQGAQLSDAAKSAAKATGHKKGDIYKALLNHRQERE